MYATRVETDLDAFRHNLEQAKKLLPQGVAIMAVIKDEAYGHGAYELALEALQGGAKMLGVATVEEGVQLRSEGIVAPILVLCGLTPEEVEETVENRLSITLYSREMAGLINAAALKWGRKVPVHLKIDTGMGRLGILPEEAKPFQEEFQSLTGLVVEGVMTHFAAAPEADTAYSSTQLHRFQGVLSFFLSSEVGAERPIAHAANSAAVLNLPQSCLDMVRLGILLYGCNPCLETMRKIPLRPVLTWKTCVLSLKRVPSGSWIGYDRTYCTSRDSLLAILRVGYADGYSRALSNRAQVLIQGKRVPLIGRISMDICAVDATELPSLREGEEVVLLGRQGEEEITAHELASLQETI
ncbi:MAG: alanine racemase, partial [Candidatus Binatia bacterium]